MLFNKKNKRKRKRGMNLFHDAVDFCIEFPKLLKRIENNEIGKYLNIANNRNHSLYDGDAYEIAKAISRNTTITHFHLRGASNNGLELIIHSLENNHNLKAVDFEVCSDIGAQEVERFLNRDNSHIEDISLRGPFGDDGCKAIAKVLETNTSIRKIKLDGYRKIGVDGASAIAKAIRINTTVLDLDIGFTCLDLGMEERKILAGGIAANTTIRNLNMKNMCFNNDDSIIKIIQTGTNIRSICLTRCSAAIVKALLNNPSIEKIDLNDTDFENSENDARALSELLKNTKTVKTMTLSYCRMNANTIRCIAEGIKVNTSIEELDLSEMGCGVIFSEHIKIIINAMDVLAEAIKVNQTLQRLNLHHSQLGYMGYFFETLADALEYNTVLQELDLSRNWMFFKKEEEGKSQMLAKFKRRFVYEPYFNANEASFVKKLHGIYHFKVGKRIWNDVVHVKNRRSRSILV